MQINGYKTGIVCTGFNEFRPGIITPEEKSLFSVSYSQEGAEWFLQKFHEHGLLSVEAMDNKKKYLDQWMSLLDEAKSVIVKVSDDSELKDELNWFISLWDEPDGYYRDQVNDVHLIYGNFYSQPQSDGTWKVIDRKNNIEKFFNTEKEAHDWAFLFVGE